MSCVSSRRLRMLSTHMDSMSSIAAASSYKEFTSEQMHHVFTVPDEQAVRIMPTSMHKATADIFKALGLSMEDATACADTLLYADTRGIDSHGVSNMMKAYVHWCKVGRVPRCACSCFTGHSPPRV